MLQKQRCHSTVTVMKIELTEGRLEEAKYLCQKGVTLGSPAVCQEYRVLYVNRSSVDYKRTPQIFHDKAAFPDQFKFIRTWNEYIFMVFSPSEVVTSSWPPASVVVTVAYWGATTTFTTDLLCWRALLKVTMAWVLSMVVALWPVIR